MIRRPSNWPNMHPLDYRNESWTDIRNHHSMNPFCFGIRRPVQPPPNGWFPRDFDNDDDDDDDDEDSNWNPTCFAIDFNIVRIKSSLPSVMERIWKPFFFASLLSVYWRSNARKLDGEIKGPIRKDNHRHRYERQASLASFMWMAVQRQRNHRCSPISRCTFTKNISHVHTFFHLPSSPLTDSRIVPQERLESKPARILLSLLTRATSVSTCHQLLWKLHAPLILLTKLG
jgi:hypothetical protein